VSGGNARCIAVTSSERLKELPDVATTGQQGYRSVNTVYWIGFSGPPGLPEYVAKAWAEAVSAVLKDADVQAKLARVTSVPAFLDQEEFKKFVFNESQLVKELIK
jgi:tripartite-type tricarboxylate transporter receptor subunit TctC